MAILIAIGSVLLIGLGIGIRLIIISVAKSQEKRIFNFIESLFPDVRLYRGLSAHENKRKGNKSLCRQAKAVTGNQFEKESNQ